MCHIEAKGKPLEINPSQLIGRLVAAQNHPIPSQGQREINNLCKTCRLTEGGADFFKTYAGMVRIEVDCSTCPAS